MVAHLVVEHISNSTLSGTTQTFAAERIGIGRMADNGVVYDATEYQLVSRYHAELYVDGDRVRIRDLDSSNGTFLNGRRIASDKRVAPGDTIELGRGGPTLRVRLDRSGEDGDRGAGVGQSTLFRVVRGAVRKERRRFALLLLAVFVVAGAGIAYVMVRQKQAEKAAPTKEGILEEAKRLALDIQRAQTAEERARLEKRLSDLQDRILETSDVDWTRQVEKYEGSIFLCLARHPGGRREIGTGFCIREDGLIATNAHVGAMLLDAPNRAVIQNGTGRVFKIVKIGNHPRYDGSAQSPDVAILKIDTDGRRLVALPLADEKRLKALKVGTRLGTIGFPGEMLAQYLREYGTGRITTVRATFKAGIVSGISDYRQQTASYANSVRIQHSASLSGGTSGSPMFTTDGIVVAIHNSVINISVGAGGKVRTPSASDISFAIRADVIREHLESLAW